MKKVVFEGKEYRNLKELCEKNNRDYKRIWYRVKHGYKLEDAMATPDDVIIKHGNSKEIEYNGVTYNSIKDMCEKLNLPYNFTRENLKKGLSVEESISKCRRTKQIVMKGKIYNQEQLCCEYGISSTTFAGRIKRGLSVEDALKKEFTCKCVICDKEFTSKIPEKKYCSKTCQNRASKGKGRYITYQYKCIVCGKEYETQMKYNNKCCSEHCRNQLTRIDRNKRYKHLKETGKFDTSVTLENVFNKFNGICQCCNKELNFKCNCNSNDYPSIDHIIPISKGGTHKWNNVQLLCRGCNIKKSNNI